ncbi:MAG: SH3 domain-containing protein [Chloroflexota bacterium]
MPDRLDDPNAHDEGTQPLSSPKIPSALGSHVQQTPASRPERAVRKRKPNDRSRSALYLPAWSVGLMLLLVFGIVAATVTLVLTLGGQSAPGGEPRIVIITAQPSATPGAILEPTATVINVEPLPTFQGPLPTFGLEGPTLVPIILSPTPLTINLGVTVIVNVDGLNVRDAAGTGNDVVTFANQGDRFVVIGGPEQASNLTWWQVQDPDDASIVGWAAADYLDVAIQ